MQVSDSLLDLVGDTPLVRLHRMAAHLRPQVLVKVEYLNPGGSVKDRIALAMVEDAEARGLIAPGGTIVEPTSGNTGVGLALVANARGYRCVFVMPDKMSAEKIAVLRAYGAEVVVCPTAVAPEHPDSYYSVSKPAGRPRSPGPGTPTSTPTRSTRSRTTAPPARRSGGRPTGGSRTSSPASAPAARSAAPGATSRRSAAAGCRWSAPTPRARCTRGGTGRPYLVEGVGEDFWPTTYDPAFTDRVLAVSDRDSFLTTRRLAREEALLVGGSCGLAVAAGLRLAEELAEDDVVVVLLPDSGRGYLSKIYNDEWMADYGFLVADGTQPTVGDVLTRKGPDLPALVHVHPDETVGSAIDVLREYGVSQMPVVQHEPPVMAAEVVGSVAERDLLEAVYADRTALQSPLSARMRPPLPMVGAGEPLSVAVAALERASALLVLDDGKPVGLVTRSDLLGFLAEH